MAAVTADLVHREGLGWLYQRRQRHNCILPFRSRERYATSATLMVRYRVWRAGGPASPFPNFMEQRDRRNASRPDMAMDWPCTLRGTESGGPSSGRADRGRGTPRDHGRARGRPRG